MVDTEKKELHNVIADLMLAILWEPNKTEGEADTAEHHIKVWKHEGSVYAEVRKVR